MSLKLVFPKGEHPQVLLGTGPNHIGSSPTADIILDGPGVLPQHCSLHVASTGVTLDIARETSVSVNNRQVTGVIALRPGDTMAIGRVPVRLVSLGSHATSEPHCAVETDLGATTIRQALPKLVLRGLTGGVFGRSYPLQSVMTVGRSPQCEITIEKPGLSGLHARLTPCQGGVEVEDLHSANGTFVNDRRITRYTARPGDEIRFDTACFRLAATGSGLSRAPAPMPVKDVPVHALQRTWAWPVALSAVLAVLAAFVGREYLVP